MQIFSRAIVLFSVFFSFLAMAQETSITGSLNGSRGSKWGGSYFNFTSAAMDAAENGFPTISIYNYLSAHYKYDKDQRFSIRPAWFMNTEGYDNHGEQKKGEASLGDLHLNYSNYAIALLPGDWDLSGQLKLYFPTSESAQMKKIITYVKGELISEKPLRNGWILQYTAKPGYWFHSQRAYRNEYNRISNSTGLEETVVEAKVNKWGELNHYFGVGKYVNSIFTPKLEVGFFHEWSYNSEQVDGSFASSNKLKIAPNTEIHVNRQLWFIFGLENQVQLNNTRIASEGWETTSGRSIKLFDPQDTQYYLMTFWSLY